ncbi:TetR/AcrR family transcriptional regulator [Serinibacter salmoneus]|uniref:TetR family transcriptional regulator n=1 Tax=Serinibacter salmoneus TaxID=556530 RepID=A0A2A9D1M2_9MICO|nr:helix-turn-helix domain-containing protein [Serinibacter salmoneus]PFG20281.1 TetR family transcriptional regulator [Serinibacter salmoneus]
MTPRERARARTEQEIRAIAWRHLEEQGAAALSLRAIAREVGIVSSAIYRYVPSREELLTDLIIEGYTDLADAAGAAEAGLLAQDGEASPRLRWLAVVRAVAAWARRRPAAWTLLYGSPVPGYAAPPERTTDAGTRVMIRLAHIVADASVRGEQRTVLTAGIEVPPGLASGLREASRAVGLDGDERVVADTVLGWTLVIALITSELFEQFGRETFADTGAWLDFALETTATAAGL